ncbi:uncharacterized protein LOC143447508 [Clavelina lepadiformis]|uniref:uncharacterized protein LOC143447508 n=1 Tax=Clavelina lepadiformis TaxID=159417 RepID=UPI0040434918
MDKLDISALLLNVKQQLDQKRSSFSRRKLCIVLTTVLLIVLQLLQIIFLHATVFSRSVLSGIIIAFSAITVVLKLAETIEPYINKNRLSKDEIEAHHKANVRLEYALMMSLAGGKVVLKEANEEAG